MTLEDAGNLPEHVLRFCAGDGSRRHLMPEPGPLPLGVGVGGPDQRFQALV